jgi:autophagy-related protein 16-1
MSKFNSKKQNQSFYFFESKNRLEEFELENKKLKEKNIELEELKIKNEAVIKVLNAERDTLQKDVEKKEKEILRLTKDNNELVDRLVLQKQKEVDAMNQVNDLSISVQKQKQELAEAKEKYKFSSNSGIGYIQVSGSGGSMYGTKGTEEKMGMTVSPPSKRSKRVNTESDVYSAQFNDNGSFLGIACDDKTIKLYNADSFQLKTTFYGSTADCTHVSFSPNGKYILGASTDAAVRIWDLNTGRSNHTLTGHTKKIQSADFNSDSSKVVSGSNDRTIKIWEMVHGTCLKTILCQSICNDLEISKTNDIIGSAHFDNAVRFWDSRSGKLIQLMKDIHSQQVTSVTFTKDGYHCLTNGRDNLLKFIDLRNYNTLLTLQFFFHLFNA